jgi:acyl-CoA synthetase (AMP-forming)/AMP-acid ligase II
VNIIALLDEAALRTSDAPAIIDGPLGAERSTSFADLRQLSMQIAALLARSGVGRGDGIVMLVPMSAVLYAVIAAALRLGAVPVFIDPAQVAAQIERCRTALPLKAFVGSPLACLYRLLKPALRAITPAFTANGWFPGTSSLAAARSMIPINHVPADLDDAPAMLSFTSGSTGAAKGLLRNHRLLATTQDILARHLDLPPGGINLATMPALVMANLGRGVTSLIPDVDLRRPGAADPARIAGAIKRWKADSLLASPSLIENLADHCLALGQTLDSLRAVFTGGAPVFPQLLDKFARAAPLARVAALYGSTEAEPIALLERDEIGPADRAAMKRGAGLPAGTPVAEIRLSILPDRWGQPLAGLSDAAMHSACLPAGAKGEIVVSGPHVSTGYLNGYGDAETKFRVGDTVWHRTGDSGWLDEHSRLWLTGRCAARIANSDGAGGAQYPLMVEAALADDSAIAHAAFLSHRGQRLLVVELKRGADRSGLQELASALPWAGIERVVSLTRIPLDRRHNAKIDYPALRAELDAHL